jgi:hypothetical protein
VLVTSQLEGRLISDTCPPLSSSFAILTSHPYRLSPMQQTGTQCASAAVAARKLPDRLLPYLLVLQLLQTLAPLTAKVFRCCSRMRSLQLQSRRAAKWMRRCWLSFHNSCKGRFEVKRR